MVQLKELVYESGSESDEFEFIEYEEEEEEEEHGSLISQFVQIDSETSRKQMDRENKTPKDDDDDEEEKEEDKTSDTTQETEHKKPWTEQDEETSDRDVGATSDKMKVFDNGSTFMIDPTLLPKKTCPQYIALSTAAFPYTTPCETPSPPYVETNTGDELYKTLAGEPYATVEKTAMSLMKADLSPPQCVAASSKSEYITASKSEKTYSKTSSAAPYCFAY